MQLPDEPSGFAVNVKTGEVHKRHAPDAVNLRRTTQMGVYSLVDDPTLCETCFPPVKQKSRITTKPKKIEPETDEEPDGASVED